MPSGLRCLEGRPLELQLRNSHMKAELGQTLWSKPFSLDVLGGVAVISVPCPTRRPSSAIVNFKAAVALALRAEQVSHTFLPDASGTKQIAGYSLTGRM